MSLVVFQDTDAALQKRSYGVLASICQHHQQWSQEHVEVLSESIRDTRGTCKGQSKKVC
jgi:hypothetical protein